MSQESLMVVDLWLAFRGGMGGYGPLPFRGGFAEQPASLIAAFRVCQAVAAILKKD